jgi:hypothetical protein
MIRVMTGRSTKAVLVLAACALMLSTLPTGALAAPVERVEDPSPRVADQAIRKMALGVATPYGEKVRKLRTLTKQLGGNAPAAWVIWSRWGDKETRAFPTRIADRLAGLGVTPMIWWEPVDPKATSKPYFPRYANIAAGIHDRYIRKYAKAAKAYGKTVLLRFVPEANGRYHPWGNDKFDNSPETFVAAWKHVWKIFKRVKATNVKFVWSVSKQNGCGPGCNQYLPWYPGDAYVDYASFSSFNWGDDREWKTMLDLSQRVTTLIGNFTSKPLMIVESASNSVGGDKAAWIAEGYPAVYDGLPSIVAVIWLNADLRYADQPDWRIASPPEALQEYKAIASQAPFKGRFKKRSGGTIADAVGG